MSQTINPIPDKTLNKTEQTYVLINLFINPIVRGLWVNKDYPKEHMASKRLRNSYPDFSFFYSLQEYYGKFNSLLGLASKKMRPELDKKYELYILNKEKNKPIILEDESVIDLGLEDKSKKYSNLIDFLDN